MENTWCLEIDLILCGARWKTHRESRPTSASWPRNASPFGARSQKARKKKKKILINSPMHERVIPHRNTTSCKHAPWHRRLGRRGGSAKEQVVGRRRVGHVVLRENRTNTGEHRGPTPRRLAARSRKPARSLARSLVLAPARSSRHDNAPSSWSVWSAGPRTRNAHAPASLVVPVTLPVGRPSA